MLWQKLICWWCSRLYPSVGGKEIAPWQAYAEKSSVSSKVLSVANVVLLFVILAGVSPLASSCSLIGCTEFVKSKDEAHKALQSFFSSDTRAAKELIGELKRDGITDEFLTLLKQGCVPCYVFQGDDPGYEPDRWYVITSIVPPEEKKRVVLKIECDRSVELAFKHYGI